ncbi:MAG: ABC transporter ATP-binding protein, partial [Lachnospiraceae bacterium]|nr:ABC transporter ATP-binding protein [Lachnospiraceae bacterium]
PRLLLLDEPLSNLDARLRIDMRSELLRLHRDLGTTIIYVTHDQTEALTMSTKIALYRRGELSQVATPMELYMNPVNLEAADFIGNPRINFLEGKARYEGGKLSVSSELGLHVFDKADMTDQTIPDGEFDVIVAVRPEQIQFVGETDKDALPVKIYANQPAGSETLVSLESGKSTFIAKMIGLQYYEIGQPVHIYIDPRKINIYDCASSNLIKRASLD